jgi:hypothetical protein
MLSKLRVYVLVEPERIGKGVRKQSQLAEIATRIL